jgi:uncharacterized oligopeptide transporter (OPT) family protein
VGYSLLSIGSGMIIGLRVTTWMMIGCVIGWIVAPLLLVQHHLLPDHPTRTMVLQWVMWPGLGMLIAGGLMTMALRWRMLFEAFKALADAGNSEDAPLSWIVGGVVVLSVALCIVQKVFFGLPIWMTAVAILLSIPMMLVGLRALGETNLMQGLFAGIAPGNVVANVMGAGTAGTIAVTSEGLIQDYKAGHLIGSSPRAMFIAQVMGAPIGAAALAMTYPLLVKTYGLIGDHAQLAAPGSRRMAAFAELLSSGMSKLPQSALWAGLIFALIGCLLAWLETNDKIKQWVPSTVALSLGVLLPFTSISVMFIGGIIGSVWLARHPASAKRYLIATASGLIAGEAIMAIAALPLIALHLGRG